MGRGDRHWAILVGVLLGFAMLLLSGERTPTRRDLPRPTAAEQSSIPIAADRATEPRSKDGPALEDVVRAEDPPISARKGLATGLLIRNEGQYDERARYCLQDGRTSVFFTRDGFRMATAGPEGQGYAVGLRFVGGRETEPAGVNESQAKVNFYVGSEDQWRSDVRTYEKLVYSDVWPGVDVVYEPRTRGLEYSLVVKPGGDVGAVRLAYDGVEETRVGDGGELVLKTPIGELKETPPRTYQNGSEIASRFRANGDGTYGFEVADYNRSEALEIDPVIQYMTYLGGSSADSVRDITSDASGNVFVCGSSASDDFPLVGGLTGSKPGAPHFLDSSEG